jgi:hypothetical protein
MRSRSAAQCRTATPPRLTLNTRHLMTPSATCPGRPLRRGTKDGKRRSVPPILTLRSESYHGHTGLAVRKGWVEDVWCVFYYLFSLAFRDRKVDSISIWMRSSFLFMLQCSTNFYELTFICKVRHHHHWWLRLPRP